MPLSHNQRTRKAVITAAGRGTRQFPATRAIQKELLPLVGMDGLTKPTIQIIIEECLASGIEEIGIVVEKGGQEPFLNHFRDFSSEERRTFASKEWMLTEGDRITDMARRITYIEQPAPEGFGHAVYQAKDFVGEEPFLLLLGDHVYTTPEGVAPCVQQILDLGERSGGSITSVRFEKEADISITGIVKGKLMSDNEIAPGSVVDIETLQEKPTIEQARVSLVTPGLPEGIYLGHFGLHLFQSAIFDCLGHLIKNNIRVKNEFQLTSGQELLLQKSLAGDGPPYRAAILNGTRWDTGMPDVYLETLLAYGLRGPYSALLRRLAGES